MHITFFFIYFFLNPYNEGSYPFIENVSTNENEGGGGVWESFLHLSKGIT